MTADDVVVYGFAGVAGGYLLMLADVVIEDAWRDLREWWLYKRPRAPRNCWPYKRWYQNGPLVRRK